MIIGESLLKTNFLCFDISALSFNRRLFLNKKNITKNTKNELTKICKYIKLTLIELPLLIHLLILFEVSNQIF